MAGEAAGPCAQVRGLGGEVQSAGGRAGRRPQGAGAGLRRRLLAWPGPALLRGLRGGAGERGERRQRGDCCGGPFDECECWEKCGRWAHWQCAEREPAVHEGIGVRFWSGWWRQGPGHWCPVCMGSPPPPKKTTAPEETFYQAKYGEEEDPEEEGLTVKPSREDEEECKQQ
mmetsp:Transcript_50678/g.162173  ORF Transcript_50678/g.162173 Transcript_50678/m.162173 type:complete len:171 (+) Transcript_50678:446-958(+)